jgi:hypothetical protein
MSKIDGGPAYPGLVYAQSGLVEGRGMGMSLRDWFAGKSSEPPQWWIDSMQSMDKARNPYNDPHKPAPRSVFQLIAEWKWANADAMLAAREGGASMSGPELLPCPFCGGKPCLTNVAMAGCTYVVCTDCRAQSNDTSQEGARAAWNRRADLAAPLAAVAMREAAIEAVQNRFMSGYSHAGDAATYAIRVLPTPDHAAILAAALRLPEIAAMVEALKVTRDLLNSYVHDQFDGVWTQDQIDAETKEADAALAALQKDAKQ